jgi:translation initiation factor IF-2
LAKAKRVFNIAKELGISSKAIVEKCHAEGIPEELIKGHMSTVSVGLEATIREWFSTHADSTAVETAEKVDIEKVRVKPRKSRAKKKVDEEETVSEGDTAVAVAERTDEPDSGVATAEPAETKPKAKKTASKKTAAKKVSKKVAGKATAAPSATQTAAPTAGDETSAPSSDQGAIEASGDDATATDSRAAAAEVTPLEPTMNVPKRPEMISPAGPKLDVRAPVKMAGPKLIRVEAPEALTNPRPRRTPGAPESMGTGGGGVRGGGGVPVGKTPDDRSRGARDATKRRSGGMSDRRRGQASDWNNIARGAWSEQDLAEREARLARSGGLLRKRRQDARRRDQSGGERALSAAETGGTVKITAPFTIKDLSAATGVKGADIVKKLFMQGIMATINSGIEPEQAQEIMIDYDIELDVAEAKDAEDVISEAFEARDIVDERPRGPVVTILGHVDHGKTSLLDRIRSANVADGEAGGITQATSAFRVPVKVGDTEKFVVFVDTPGHEAFTEMRSRGATITDLVVLVVAADDGVMPQTVESINHAKAAGVPIVVALNKMDKPEATDANIQRILGELAENGLNPTDWGGETEVIRTSAIKNEGIQDLLEVLEYQSQLLELKADFGGAARGAVIESRVVEGRGPVANILLQEGQLKVGQFIVAGRAFGRVRDIIDDRGKRLKEADPPRPIQISGIDMIPDAGDKFYIVDSLKKAQEAAEQRRHRERETQLAQPKVTLDALFTQMAESELKEICIVLKADVQGSIDVLRHEIEGVTTEEVKIRVIHSAVGGITESDVLLADASKAIIVGFNVIASGRARSAAETKGVEIRNYQVIYHIVDDVKKAAEGMLEPELRQEVIGHAEVRQVFKVSKVGAIAGCYVTNGTVERDALIRVTRGDIVIENDRKLEQLKRFKDDAKEVRSGMECGMKIVDYDDIKEGDILECYKNIEVKRTL